MSEHPFMDDYMRPPPPTASTRGYSLAALFLLVTTSGVVAALARNASLQTDWKLQADGGIIFAHAAVGCLVGAVIGFVSGLAYPRAGAAGLLGAFAGALAGGICAAVAAAGASIWLFLLGAAALIVMGIGARAGQRRRRQ